MKLPIIKFKVYLLENKPANSSFETIRFIKYFEHTKKACRIM